MMTTEPLRLDQFLTQSQGISRTAAQTLISAGLVTVNQRPGRAGQKVRQSDEVVVSAAAPADPIALEGPKVDLAVVFEDDYLAVIDKPSGMVVHPAAGHRDGTLADGLRQRGSTWSYAGGAERPGIVHRLDRDVSGLLVVAKTEVAHRALAEQLAQRTMVRIYWALVWGGFDETTATITAPIGRDSRDRKRMAVSSGGKPSITDVTVLERGPSATTLDVRLRTGRTHQIRVHLAYIDHPIVGDPVYGRKSDPHRGRPALHARQLSFIHPGDGERHTFNSPPPADLRELAQIVNQVEVEVENSG